MLSNLLKPEVQAFIQAQEKSDPKGLALDRFLFNKHKYPGLPIGLIVDQLRARAKAKTKLPLWHAAEGVVMPPLLSMEQSSSQEAALYKSKMFNGDLAIDLTGGAGVDAYFLSKQFKRVKYIEHNTELVAIAKHNFSQLGASNIEVLHTNSEAFISTFNGKADLIYIDPARRDQNKKLFLFEDCSPNLITLQTQLLQKSKQVLVKASPMLDIAKGVDELQQVGGVKVVAIKNEVKELLFTQNKGATNNIKITAIDLASKQQFKCNWEQKEKATLGAIASYLYEPNAAILKTGKVDLLGSRFDVLKLNRSTHLFTSAKLKEDFPGRRFKVISVLKYEKKEIRKNIPSLKANISTRNFPESVDSIRKKTGIKEGGSTYLFAVRDLSNKTRIILCAKI